MVLINCFETLRRKELKIDKQILSSKSFKVIIWWLYNCVIYVGNFLLIANVLSNSLGMFI